MLSGIPARDKKKGLLNFRTSSISPEAKRFEISGRKNGDAREAQGDTSLIKTLIQF